MAWKLEKHVDHVHSLEENSFPYLHRLILLSFGKRIAPESYAIAVILKGLFAHVTRSWYEPFVMKVIIKQSFKPRIMEF